MSEHGLVPLHLSIDRFAVRIQQQLRWIAAIAGAGIPGAVYAKSVSLTGTDVRDVAVPDESSHLRQMDASLLAVVIEKAKLDARGHLGENGKIRPRAVVGSAERVGISRPDLHRGITAFLADHA